MAELDYSRAPAKTLGLYLPIPEGAPEGTKAELYVLTLRNLPARKWEENDKISLENQAELNAGKISVQESFYRTIELFCTEFDRTKFSDMEFYQIREVISKLRDMRLGNDDEKKN